MTQLFLAPRGHEFLHEGDVSTIEVGRPYSFVEPYLDDAEKGVLLSHKTVKVWANKEALRSRWSAMKPGDYVLFYGHGVFYLSGRIVLTKFSPELAQKLWKPDDEDGMTWPCLFFVDDVRQTNIPLALVQELAEYDPTWDRVMGFMRLNDRGHQAIIAKFGSIKAFIQNSQDLGELVKTLIESKDEERVEDEEDTTSSKEQLLEEAKAFESQGPGYKTGESPKKVRIENRIQKKRVAKIEDYSCQICGWQLEWVNSEGKKVFRIDVDHIVDKADGGGEELGNLWALCPNHHTEKTLGVIVIDPKSKTITRNGGPISLHHDHHLEW